MFKQTAKPQQAGYMQQLNEWLDENVIYKLSAAFEGYAADAEAGLSQAEAAAKVEPVAEAVKKALREKMLESYRNGQAAGLRKEGRRYAR
jgi:hypothetical protein